MPGAPVSAYEAAIELVRAVDTLRVLTRVGWVTHSDLVRVETARRRLDGSAPRRYSGRRS